MYRNRRALLAAAFSLFSLGCLAQGLSLDLGLDSLRAQSSILPGAGLDFNFQTSQFYQAGQTAGDSSLITVSRASVGYADDTSGNWLSFNNNVGRITNKGLLVEEARTNSIRNNSMQGAVPGTPGTLPTNTTTVLQNVTQTISGPSTENGIDYIDIQFSGTPNATGNIQILFEATTQIAALYGQTWTGSLFVYLKSGSLTNFGNISLVTQPHQSSGAGGIGNNPTVFTPGAGPLGSSRIKNTYTNSNSLTAFEDLLLLFAVTNGNAVNATFRIGWPQLENNNINSTVASATQATGGATCTNGAQLFTVSGGTGTASTLTGTVVANALQAGSLTVTTAGSYTVFPPSPATVTGGGCGTPPTVNLVPTDNSAQGFATSPIRTTAAAATRAADLPVPTNTPAFGSAYTLFGKGTPNAPAGYAVQQVLLDVDDGTGNNRADIRRLALSGLSQNIIVVGGVQQTSPAAGAAWSQSTSGKIAMALTAGDQAESFNGAAVTTSTTTPLFTPSTIRIGSQQNGAQQFNGYIERIALWPSQRLPNATLQSLAAP